MHLEGHLISHTGTFQQSDGSIGAVEDVWFEVDSRTASKILDSDFEIAGEAMLHPILYGYGKVASTWVALSENAALRASSSSLLQQLQQGNVIGFLQSFDVFLLEWAGVSDVNPASRGGNIDARHLAFLEALYGERYGSTIGTSPGSNAGAALEAHFADLVQTFAARYMAQSASRRSPSVS